MDVRVLGIPPNEVPDALKAFDKFFPTGGWFASPGQTSMVMVKMVPWRFQGLGAHYRRVQYSMQDLAGLKASGYTHSDLAKRINCAVEYLA